MRRCRSRWRDGRTRFVGGHSADSHARVDCRATEQELDRFGRPAKVAERSEPRVERVGDRAGQVGCDPAGAAVGLADEVKAVGREAAEYVGTDRGDVRRHDGVGDGDPPGLSNVKAAPDLECGVATDGAVSERDRPRAFGDQSAAAISGAVVVKGCVGQCDCGDAVEHTATIRTRRVAADRAIGQRGRAEVVGHAATIEVGEVTIDGAVRQYDRPASGVAYSAARIPRDIATDGAVGEHGAALV